MKLRYLSLLMVAVLAFGLVACGKLKAKDQLNKGIQAYKDKEYEAAEKYFTEAVKLDEGLDMAWENLAQARLQQISTTMGNPADIEKAMGAIEVYEKLKEKNKSAMAYRNIAKLYARLTQCQATIVTPEKQKEYVAKARQTIEDWMKVDPSNKEPIAMMAEFIINQSDKALREKMIVRNSDLDKLEDADVQPILALVDEGLKYYADAQKIDPNDIKIVEGMIVAYNQKLLLTKDYAVWDEMNKILGDLKVKRYEMKVKQA